MGKPKDPDYWKKWRAAHPEYRERERRRMAARTDKSHGDRAGQEARRKSRRRLADGENGWTEKDHPLLQRAEEIAALYVSKRRPMVLRTDRGTGELYDPIFEETTATVVLALLEGDDPLEAAERCVRTERKHRFYAALDVTSIDGRR